MHEGGSASLTQTTTTRGPSAFCTCAGDDGQCWVESGAHPPLGSGPHQLSIAVPKSALRSRPEIAAVTARVSGAVSEVGLVPADDAIIAACSTADTSADVCTAQRPASSAAIRQNRKSGSTTANSTSA